MEKEIVVGSALAAFVALAIALTTASLFNCIQNDYVYAMFTIVAVFVTSFGGFVLWHQMLQEKAVSRTSLFLCVLILVLITANIIAGVFVVLTISKGNLISVHGYMLIALFGLSCLFVARVQPKDMTWISVVCKLSEFTWLWPVGIMRRLTKLFAD